MKHTPVMPDKDKIKATDEEIKKIDKTINILKNVSTQQITQISKELRSSQKDIVQIDTILEGWNRNLSKLDQERIKRRSMLKLKKLNTI